MVMSLNEGRVGALLGEALGEALGLALGKALGEALVLVHGPELLGSHLHPSVLSHSVCLS